MRTLALRLASPATILVAAGIATGAAASTDMLHSPEEAMEIAEPVSGAAETAGRQHGDVTSDPAVAATADIDAPPESRLLRSLSDQAAPPALDPSSPEPRATGIDVGAGSLLASGGPGSSPVFHGCPRALLNALLASAAETDDAVSALAIERETLSLCRERQEIVNGIVALEGELGTLLAEAWAMAAGPVAGTVGSTVSDTPIVKESAPVRVVSLPPPTGVAGEVPKEAEAPADPAPPSYFWFSIIGTAGDLRAGVSGGAENGRVGGGTSVWFVREGDRLPGGVRVTRIVARPPGVRVSGAVEAALPYRPRPAGTADPRGDAGGSGNTPSGGNTPSDGRTAGDGS